MNNLIRFLSIFAFVLPLYFNGDNKVYLPMVRFFTFENKQSVRIIDPEAERTQLCGGFLCHEITVEFDGVSLDNCPYPERIVVDYSGFLANIRFTPDNGMLNWWVGSETYALLQFPYDISQDPTPGNYLLEAYCYVNIGE